MKLQQFFRILVSVCQLAGATASGCGAASPWTFDSTQHSNQTIGDRAFLVHIPDSYDSSVPHAVVLSYHGFKGNDTQQEEISAFSESGLEINGKVRTSSW
jgi:poly(3-hydroxybutyrate) depolymerase